MKRLYLNNLRNQMIIDYGHDMGMIPMEITVEELEARINGASKNSLLEFD